jgi:hypothetical protein
MEFSLILLGLVQETVEVGQFSKGERRCFYIFSPGGRDRERRFSAVISMV